MSEEARALLLEQKCGVLSTHSVDMPGYPFGSVTPYCLDRDGRPAILISRIAQHTKNIAVNPKVSLTVFEYEKADAQASARLTWLADAVKVTPDTSGCAERYYRFFPAARDYHKTHDFDFYQLNPARIRYIGGFGKIFWVEPAALDLKNPFSASEERSMLEHMNQDHREALIRYLEFFKNIPDSKTEPATMTGIDAFGFDVALGDRRHRFTFHKEIRTIKEAREALVEMARSGRA